MFEKNISTDKTPSPLRDAKSIDLVLSAKHGGMSNLLLLLKTQ